MTEDPRAASARINGKLGGRPKSASEIAERAAIRLTPSERATIEAAAARAGVPWSRWVVEMAMKAAKRSRS
jgi:uncharacterized protein (DUF1778 family)